ncbi:MAG: hydantoinase B/oxoprolinase family protein [Pseudomonadota bacterium]
MTLNRYRLAFDIGGTFTDFVLLDEASGRVHLHKCLTTPDDPSIGALTGMNALMAETGTAMDALSHVVHGTTLVTNALIERKGCRTGLLTTKGFRDVLQFGTEQRYDIHDLFLRFPDPLVPRQLRLEIDERVASDGTVIAPLDRAEVRAQAGELVASGCEAITIAFLHSYAHPAHEKLARDVVHQAFPDIAVTASSDVHGEIREYERTSTAVANAYVQPRMAAYVKRIEDALAANGFEGRFHLIQSSGGLTTPETAARLPVRFLESGPAGGAQATAFIGRAIGRDDIISFDMGGTTAKACLIRGGAPDIAPMLETARVHRFKRGSGIPIHAPVIDMIEIGAGGGSIARVDDLGLLKVGPDSAGADPGPACYGRGGHDVSVTDANLLLGYLDPNYFLGGRMALDVNAARAALDRLAQKLGLSAIDTAFGIYDLVCENMAGAARVHIVEKGSDPRRYGMVAMGGAGPLHAVRVAEKLGVGEVVVPPASGAASALGFLAAPAGYETSRSLPMALDACDFDAVNTVLAELEAHARARLVEAGTAPDTIAVSRKVDMRLKGQMHEITVALPSGAIDGATVAVLRERFAEEYARLYTHVFTGAAVEMLNWRAACTGPTPQPSTRLAGEGAGGTALKGTRRATFADGPADATVYDRYALAPGTEIIGPAIIEEHEATTIVPPNAEVMVDGELNLRIHLKKAVARDALVGADDSLEEAAARIEADPIGLEIMWSRLINVAEECWTTVIRTAFSLIIGEAQDFACEILDANGQQLVHSPRAMPVFNITLPTAINAMIERFPAGTLAEGDVLVTNDPWLCAGHLFDIAIAVPVFRNGKVVAFVGVVGHVSDIGGTKDELNAREVFDEGLQIPPMKLFKAGEANEDLFTIIGENVRRPEQVLGDIHALVAAGRTGAERIGEFMDEYTMHDLAALAKVVQARAEVAMKKGISAVPDGSYTHELMADGIDERTMRYPIKLTIDGDTISVDFEGAPKQLEKGGSNCTLTYTKAHATYPLKCVFSPEVPGNAGCYRPMAVEAPKGSILNCDKPKSVNIRTRTGWYIAPNVFAALAGAAPDKVQAFTGLPSSLLYYGQDPDGVFYSDHLFQGGGQGASAHGDGISGLLYPTSAANTSVEVFETRVPVLVIEKGLVADTGGPGKRRGGLAQRIRTRKLHDDGAFCQVGIYPNGVFAPIDGLFGGGAGEAARGWIEQRTASGESVAHDLGVGALRQLSGTDEEANLQLCGGSGYGEPTSRPVDLVQADLDAGYITIDGARRDYGCVVGSNGRIDERATQELRSGRATIPA